jgi:hypothetical protein
MPGRPGVCCLMFSSQSGSKLRKAAREVETSGGRSIDAGVIPRSFRRGGLFFILKVLKKQLNVCLINNF